MRTEAKFGICITAILVLAALGYYIFCLNHVDVTDIGIAYNSLDGAVTVRIIPVGIARRRL